MIRYRVDLAQPQAHVYALTLTVPDPAVGQVVSLPVWIPGSYLVREFARHLSALEARQGDSSCQVEQRDKTTWVVHCRSARALTLRWRVYAFDTSVRTAFLDADRGFFNGSSLLLRVHGREHEPHRLTLGRLPRGWSVATAMAPVAGTSHQFAAADYDELIDHPFALGRFWRGTFDAAGVAHEFVVVGAPPAFDGQRLLDDTRRICETAIAFWHGEDGGRPPFQRFLFLLHAVEDGWGGLEHRASTALIASRRDLPRLGGESADADGALRLLGLVSHEYFHAWNVKRLMPVEFARLDLERENYTSLLWFFEGVTSYYDDLLLRRAGLVDAARYLALIAKTLSDVGATPGRHVQSVAEASFDAWTKYYRPDENTPNATVSYYLKGSLVALALDLSLRRQGGSLDAAMRGLWRRCGGGPIGEADIAAAFAEQGARSYATELAAWVHGRDDLPLPALLGDFGIQCSSERSPWALSLGLRLAESAGAGIQVKTVLAGSAAAAAGLSPGDELLAVDGWRLRRFDDALIWIRRDQPFDLLLARDQRVRTLRVRPAADSSSVATTVTLTLAEPASDAMAARRRAWIDA